MTMEELEQLVAVASKEELRELLVAAASERWRREEELRERSAPHSKAQFRPIPALQVWCYEWTECEIERSFCFQRMA
jgi:hypothetical protein